MGCSPQGCKQSDTTEQHFHFQPLLKKQTVNTESHFTRPLSQTSHVSLISEKTQAPTSQVKERDSSISVRFQCKKAAAPQHGEGA